MELRLLSPVKKGRKKERKSNKEYQRQWYLKNREKKLAQNHEWRKNNKKRMAILVKEWALKNKEKRERSQIKSELKRKEKRHKLRPLKLEMLRLKKSIQKEKNKEAVRLRKNLKMREWRRKNPTISLEQSAAKRARRKNATLGDRSKIRDFYKLVRFSVEIKCFYCEKEVEKRDRHIDHKVPLSRGGFHSIDNLCCACSSCNMKKHTMTDKQFLSLIKKWRNDNGA